MERRRRIHLKRDWSKILLITMRWETNQQKTMESTSKILNQISKSQICTYCFLMPYPIVQEKSRFCPNIRYLTVSSFGHLISTIKYWLFLNPKVDKQITWDYQVSFVAYGHLSQLSNVITADSLICR
jgi:multisubunit Na+/H+ antiporter MnhB subunit